MSDRARQLLAAAGLVLILGGAGWTTWRHEQTLAQGKVVFLELAPVDPRSIMQGDYMALRFAIAAKVDTKEAPRHGRLVLKLDPRGVGTFARMDVDGSLAADEMLLEYRIRRNAARIVTDAYFFQEGTGDRYTRARYGELRARDDGVALLVGLRGAALETLGGEPPLSPRRP